MSNEAVSKMGDLIGMLTLKGAASYILQHKLTLDTTKVAEACSRHSKAALPQALEDVKAAYACHMKEAGEMSFKMSFINAGIAAAKEVHNAQTSQA